MTREKEREMICRGSMIRIRLTDEIFTLSIADSFSKQRSVTNEPLRLHLSRQSHSRPSFILVHLSSFSFSSSRCCLVLPFPLPVRVWFIVPQSFVRPQSHTRANEFTSRDNFMLQTKLTSNNLFKRRRRLRH